MPPAPQGFARSEFAGAGFGAPQTGARQPAGLTANLDLAPTIRAPTQFSNYARFNMGLGARIGIGIALQLDFLRHNYGPRFGQHARLHPDFVAVRVAHASPAMGLSHDEHRQALTLIAPENRMIEVWALAPMHGRVAQRFKARQWLAGEATDLYNFRRLARIYCECAQSAQEGRTE